ncbi:amino acid adenylation domain-containing protein [Zooshikella marina]|uniref:non-ribosomal peptide synthetase/type I polyketide synthase n=1 Tax=Zooshikella ganghwensis TaxID=202772 RepID=UPI001BB02050|nr:non-ribosomal peptide synthetase/type I polyketide synthase [Zooshikella ganghwensis]MBU2708592.1 amino acid adenylation domain-containing protein [Zooshikella ganghwensis]
MTIISLLNDLKCQHIFLWVNEAGELNYSFDKNRGFPDAIKQQVIAHKAVLIELLNANKINNEEQAKASPFLSLPRESWPAKLDSIQQGMYLQGQIDSLPYTYTIPLFIAFNELDAQRMQQAIQLFLKKHPLFCQSVADDLQRAFLPASLFHCPVREISSSELQQHKDSLAKTVFPLEEGQFTCFELLYLADKNTWVLACIHHHMLSDAYSVPVIADELAAAYENPQRFAATLKQPTYLDYSAYQQAQALGEAETQFKDRLIAELNEAEVPQLRQCYSATGSNAATHLTATLTEEEYQYLTDLCGKHELTLYPLLFTHFIHSIAVYTGQNESFPVGMTLANRPEAFQAAIGPFINTLPVVPALNRKESVLANAKTLHHTVIQYQQMNNLNIEQLVEGIQGGAPRLAELVQVLFTLHNFDEYSAQTQNTEYQIQPYADLAEKFGISLIAGVQSSCMSFTLTYAAEKYEQAQIEAIFNSFVDSLKQHDEGVWLSPLSQLLPISNRVEHQLLQHWNDTRCDFSDQTHVAAILEHQVEQTPHNLAVADAKQRLTYQQLNERANQLAHYLIAQGVVQSSLVALSLERSVDTVISIWAVLKTGAAYIPLEPDFPQDRVEYILSDSQAAVILAHSKHADSLVDYKERLLLLDTPETHRLLADQQTQNLSVAVNPTDLAYVIYTSGTTGKPKGVMCEHRGLVNRIEWMQKNYPLAADDRVLQKTPYVFDVSVWELLWANWYGAAIIMAEPDGHKDADYLIELIEREKISTLHFVPSMLSAFTQTLGARPNALARLVSLKYMFCSGEALHLSQVKDIKALLPDVQLHNLYGPTEASIDVLFFDCNDPALSKVLIGKPIDNIQALVLDENLRLLPPGAVGELHLAGVGLARGYLNNPALTAEKFVENPYQSTEDKQHGINGRLYKTGDLVYQQPDGSVVYLGRNDFQVKIRGFRIELGDITTNLELHPLVSQAAVTVVKDTQPWLVGYIVAADECSDEMLKSHLLAALPEYMVPESFVRLDALPVTVNGKLNVKALPIPERTLTDNVVAPKNQLEASVRDIVAALLGLEPQQLGCSSNLYQLGLDSIMAIRLVSQLRQASLLDLSVKDVFALKTISALCQLAGKERSSITYQVEEGVLSGEVPLLPIQCWFFTRQFNQPEHWNQAFCIDVPLLEQNALQHAVSELVKHHDALRLHYTDTPEGQYPRQFYGEQQPVNVIKVNLDEHTDAQALSELMTSWQSSFDLTSGSLFQFVYMEGLKPDRGLLFCAFHHLIMDSVSWGIIVHDLQVLYQGKKLPQKGSSYRQWSQCIEQYPHQHPEELRYWQALMEDYRVPQGFLSNKQPFTSSQIKLPQSLTQSLLGECHKAFNTQINDVLIAAADTALTEVLAGEVTHISLEGHGREVIAEVIDSPLDIERTVGWFTSLSPYKLQSCQNLQTTLIGCKEQLRAMPGKGVGYGAWAQSSDLPIPSVCFNYLGQLDTLVQPTSEHTEQWHLVVTETGQTIGHPEDWPFSITIFGFVVDGQLHIEVKSCLTEAVNQKLLNCYQTALVALVDLCANQKTTEYSASDFKFISGEADLAQLPLSAKGESTQDFAMTEIQKAYLLGRMGQYEIGNVANHIYNEYVYSSLDINRLENAINELISLCPVLRTVFDENIMRQRYLPTSEVGHYCVHTNYFDVNKSDATLADVRHRLSHTVYDVSCFPLFTFEVSQFKDCYVLHVSIDLILLDVQSRLMMYSLLDRLYRGEDITASLPKVNFKDYQDYVVHLPNSVWYEKDKAYWAEKLQTLPLRPNLPLKQEPMNVTQPTFSEHTLYLEPEIWQQFKKKTQDYQVSYSSVLLALYGYLIARFSGNDEFLITLTLFNRYPVCERVDEILGDFTSTNLFHFKDAGSQLLETITCTHDRMWDDVNHALYNGIQVQRELVKRHQLDANAATSPIVFTGVIGQQTDRWEKRSFLVESELREQRYWCAQTSQAWIDLQAVESGDRFMSKWLYVDQLFEPDFIPHLNHCYCELITHLATQEWARSVPRGYLPPEDERCIALINSANQPVSEETLVSLFEKQAREAHRIAVYDERLGQSYTYAQLQQDSERLASHCVAMEGELIAVLADKGYAQLCACLAIMKAGKGYLPLHVDWPEERMNGVLAQAEADHLLITELQAQRDFKLMQSISSLCIETALADEFCSAKVSLPEVKPDDVAYVIFTSGSTGKPKGVTISHRGAVNTIVAVNEQYNVTADDALFALSELSFDLSVYDLFGALAVGAKVVFPDQQHVKTPDCWLPLIQQEKVSIWNTVPQLAGLLEEAASATNTPLPSLRLFMMSGDWIPLNLLDRLAFTFPAAKQLSLGGATEGSIWSIWYPIESRQSDWASVPYGKAMPNQTMSVLDNQLQPCPVGVTGEIYIGGLGVALSYWKNEALTGERFIEHPDLGRIYKTGDLGRVESDGNIIFQGRNDFQVKVRGHRIELGEIEAVITQFEGVEQSLVLTQPVDGENSAVNLVGYYVTKAQVDELALRQALASRLPEYMVPPFLIALDSLPLTANGKLDRAALPMPNTHTSNQHCQPSNSIEAKLCQLWAGVLNISQERLGIHDDIFSLGCDSVMAIQMVGRLRREMQVELGLRELFTYRSVATLAEFVSDKLQNSNADVAEPQTEQPPLTGEVPLLPIQQWFFSNEWTVASHWNQTAMLVTPPLSFSRLEQAVSQVVAHHDAFALRFTVNDCGEWVQHYQPDSAKPACHRVDIRELSVKEHEPGFDACLKEALANLHSQFDLANGPLSVFAYLDGFSDGQGRLFMAWHHLIIDTVSQSVLIEDLYQAYLRQPLGSKSSSYRQWSELVNSLSLTDEEMLFWQSQLPGPEAALLASSKGSESTEYRLQLSSDTTDSLLERTRPLGMQPQDCLAWTLSRFLQQYTGQQSHSLWLEGHGRQHEHETLDVSRTMGWFTSRYPVRLTAKTNGREQLIDTKNQLRRCAEKGLSYGAAFSMPCTSLDGVSLNYLGRIESTESSPWQLALAYSELSSHTENPSLHLLEVVSWLANGQLQLLVKSSLRDITAQNVAEALSAQLDMLLAELGDEQRTWLTESDVNFVVSQNYLDQLQKHQEVEQVFRANSLQQGMIHHSLAYGDQDASYRIAVRWDYHAQVEPQLFHQAWQLLQKQLACLRSRFDWRGEIVQVVDREMGFPWAYHDFSDMNASDREQALAQLQQQDRQCNYDLSAGGLFRVCLVKLDQHHYCCLFNVHHAILDGWSSPILMAHLHDIYDALQKDAPLPLVSDAFSAVQNYIQQQQNADKDYWSEYLSDVEEAMPLSSLLHPEVSPAEYRQQRQVKSLQRLSLKLSNAELSSLSGLAQKYGITVNSVFLFAWHKLLSLYSGAAQTVVGTVIAGRMLPVAGIEHAVGMFLNTLPIKHQHDTGTSILAQISALQDAVGEANSRSLVSLADLQQGGSRLFDSLYVFENYPDPSLQDDLDRLHHQFVSREEHRDYPLALQVEEQADAINIYLDFATEWFSPTKMQQALNVLQQIVTQVLADPDEQQLQFAPSIMAGEKLQNMVPAIPTRNLAAAIGHYACHQPDAPALCHSGEVLSYIQLHQQVLAVAYCLHTEYAISSGQRVALLMPRDALALTVILAIGRLGATYVPLSYDYPAERIEYILQDCQADCLVTDGLHDQLLPNVSIPTLVLDSAKQALLNVPANLAEPEIKPQDTAYILYTSGTTGQPKGVALSNSAFMATLHGLWQAHFPNKTRLNTFSMTNMVFDIFGAEFGLPFLSGGTLTLGDYRESPINCQSLDFIQTTPSMLEFTLPSFEQTTKCTLLVGGEALSHHLAQRALAKFSRVINVYGPTETCIWSTSKTYLAGQDTGVISIGRPLPGERCTVLGLQGEPVPSGACGELYIGGTGVAQGYVNKPELNESRFIRLPFADGTWYRTGDTVRQLDDGSLLFMGRQDGQIKVMGHRIEKADIEQAMLAHPQIQQVTVQLVNSSAGSSNAQVLVGYYVSSAADMNSLTLAQWLKQKLPDYMVPEQFIALEALPMSVNGKLNSKALPAPTFDSPATDDEAFKAESEPLVQVLQSIWCQLLQRQSVGLQDKFFELGGNSILLTRMHGLLPANVQSTVSLIDLFKLPTIASIVHYVEQQASTEKPAEVVPKAQSIAHTDIAIIGMSGRFPQSETLAEFWEHLKAGKELVSRYSVEELQGLVPESQLSNPNYVLAQSKLEGIECFDAGFFGLTAKEAMMMDPQHRVFLECVWHAFENANYDPLTITDDVGVYASVGNNHYESDYVLPSMKHADLVDHYQVMISNQSHFLATRVAYTLNLTGPAMTVQTACSSSLVAVHQACRAIQAGDCQMAIAGGISLGQLEKQGYLYQPGMIFSADGHCRPFDSESTGTIEGQGVGVVLLKPLAQALEHGDSVIAVIKGSAINNDGNHKAGFTAPSEDRQAAVIQQAMANAQVSADDLSYIEAHGTGTKLGDPIEIAGLSQALSGRTSKQPCAIGALKSNLGHLDVAAGIAGLIKVALCLQHKTLVPTVHFQQENAELKLATRGFKVQQTTEEWTQDQGSGLRTAGVSAFGIGGTNAHVILQEAPEMSPSLQENVTGRPLLLCLSAPDEEGLRRQSKAMATFVRGAQTEQLVRAGYTLMHSRSRFDCQRVVTGNNSKELAEALVAQPQIIHKPGRAPSVVFMFPGQGAQYKGMTQWLFDNEPAFRFWVEQCLDIVAPMLGSEVSREDLLAASERINDTAITHPALFICEFALAKWLMDKGVSPAAMIGHSLGEYVAACCAGVLSLTDALSLVIKRGQLLASLPQGRMVSVRCTYEEIRPFVETHQLDFAAINEAQSCVISGAPDKVAALEAELNQQGITYRSVKVSRAFHSAMLDPILDDFAQLVGSVQLNPPVLPYISNLSGDWIKPEQTCSVAYWVEHLRQTVMFEAGLSTLFSSKQFSDMVLVEVGPGTILSGLAKRHQGLKPMHHVIQGLAERSPYQHLMSMVGQLFCLSAPVDLQKFWQLSPENRIKLPGYAFARDHYWIGENKAKTVVPEAITQENTISSDKALNEQVSDICCHVLGLETVNPDADFFELGGDSLTAVQYSSRVTNQFGVAIEFMQLPRLTVNAIVTALNAAMQKDQSEEQDTIVLLQKGKPSHPPIILIHPIGGDIYFYWDLAKALPEDYPVYAIRSPMLTSDVHFSRLEDMAESYLQGVISCVSKKQTPIFAGSSFGGIVAYEMTQQYKHRYGVNAPVIMVDSPCYGNLPDGMSGAEILDYLLTFGMAEINVDNAVYAALETLEDKVEYLGKISQGTAYESILSAAFLPRYLRVWECNNGLMQKYQPSKSVSDILFFAHTDVIPSFPAHQDRFWKKLGHTSFKVIPVAGNHLTMNGPKNSAFLAESIADWYESEICHVV